MPLPLAQHVYRYAFPHFMKSIMLFSCASASLQPVNGFFQRRIRSFSRRRLIAPASLGNKINIRSRPSKGDRRRGMASSAASVASTARWNAPVYSRSSRDGARFYLISMSCAFSRSIIRRRQALGILICWPRRLAGYFPVNIGAVAH